MMTARTLNGMAVRRGLPALATTLALFILATCGGGGGSSSNVDPNDVTINGVVDDGGDTSPIANATCRFVDTNDQTHDTATSDQNGIYQLSVPPSVQGFINCSPQAVPSLSLSTFSSTMGVAPGGVIDDENVTPATTVTADIIQHEDSADPESRKRELLSDIVTKADPNLEIVVAMATRLYRAMLAQNVNAGFRSGGNGGSDGDGGDGGARSDDGGVGGDAGDGADFSPLPEAQCSFLVGTDPLSAEPAYPSAMADFLADGELDRPDLVPLASSVNEGLDYTADDIKKAFDAVFPQGMGEGYTTVADAEGRFFMPIPANLPGFVRCTPKDHEALSLATYVPGRNPGVVLEDQDVTPATTVFSYVIAPLIKGDLATTKANFLADIEGLEVLLSGDNLPAGPLTGIALDPDPLPANPEVGLVAFTVTALYNAFYKNGLDVDFAALIDHLVENQGVDPDYLTSLGLPTDQASIVKETVDTASSTLDTDLPKALSTAKVNVTVMDADDGGALVEGAQIDIPELLAPTACDGCGTNTDDLGQLALTISGIAQKRVTPITVTVSSVAGFEPVSAATEVVALASVDLNVTLSSATTFDLTVQGAGAGGGSITSAPAGIDCTTEADSHNGDCIEPYEEGTEVVLTATPDADSAFSGWSGGCSDEALSCTVIMAADTTVTASFALRCSDDSYAIDAAASSMAADGGTGSIAVTAPDGCPWSASTNVPWIEITNGGGSGDGTVSYTVAANTGNDREDTITIGDRTHTINQSAGACTYSIDPSSQSVPAVGGSYDVAVTATHAGCAWTTTGTPSWASLKPTSGTGSGTVSVTIVPNSGAARKVDITIAGQTHSIDQANADPVVSVSAIDDVATETQTANDPGTFRISRTGDTAASLRVYISMAGTAEYGVDYLKLPEWFDIESGHSFLDVTLLPEDNPIPEPYETAQLVIESDPDGAETYIIGASDRATVTIRDNDALLTECLRMGYPIREGIETGFFMPGFPGINLSMMTLDLTIDESSDEVLTFELTAHKDSFDGAIIGSATTSVTFKEVYKSVDFTFIESPKVDQWSAVAFTLSVGSGPDTPQVYYAVQNEYDCTIFVPGNKQPPFDTKKHSGVITQIIGTHGI